MEQDRGSSKEDWWEFGPVQEDARSRNNGKGKSRGNWLTQVHLEKWPLNVVCVRKCML